MSATVAGAPLMIVSKTSGSASKASRVAKGGLTLTSGKYPARCARPIARPRASKRRASAPGLRRAYGVPRTTDTVTRPLAGSNRDSTSRRSQGLCGNSMSSSSAGSEVAPSMPSPKAYLTWGVPNARSPGRNFSSASTELRTKSEDLTQIVARSAKPRRTAKRWLRNATGPATRTSDTTSIALRSEKHKRTKRKSILASADSGRCA
mmetsp:Transcript_116902/g.330753  ORF Transcript_116902/g.330753 Transcript_116902/m.330753 type:complete len:206 (-) Transcript_116902:915-1532(-)